MEIDRPEDIGNQNVAGVVEAYQEIQIQSVGMLPLPLTLINYLLVVEVQAALKTKAYLHPRNDPPTGSREPVEKKSSRSRDSESNSS